jgi:glycine/D-amino acid oxidase-like deaminating enzyme
VIGAGYTGLSTAIALRQRGVSTAIVERDYAGFGASGRNAGHLTPTIGKDLPSLLRGFGRERGGALVKLADGAVEHVESTITDRAIDCDYEPVGNVVAGITAAQSRRLERAARAGIELGAALSTLEPDELRSRGLPAAFTCGYLEERGGILNPVRYLRGLRNAATDAGAELWERSPVLEIEPAGEDLVLRTPRGELRCRHLVIATNAFSRELGRPARGPVPIRVCLMVSEPLTPETRQRLGWEGREGIYTAHEVLESHRWTADDRILSGSRYVRYGEALQARDPDVFAKVEAMFRLRFPELDGIAVARFWTGPIGFNLNFLPWVGRDADARTSWAVGFAGHGVALASLAGTWLARLATGEEAGVEELTGARRIPMPPEPLRGLIARGLIAGLERLDARSDRRAAKR